MGVPGEPQRAGRHGRPWGGHLEAVRGGWGRRAELSPEGRWGGQGRPGAGGRQWHRENWGRLSPAGGGRCAGQEGDRRGEPQAGIVARLHSAAGVLRPRRFPPARGIPAARSRAAHEQLRAGHPRQGNGYFYNTWEKRKGKNTKAKTTATKNEGSP